MQSSGEAWFFDETRRMHCRALEYVSTWGRSAVRVWYPDTETLALAPPESLKPIQSLRISDTEISYLAAGARVADAIQENVLLAYN